MVSLGSWCGQSVVMLGSCWGQFEVMLGSVWDHVVVSLGSCWGQFGVSLGSCLGHFGLWGHFGDIVGSFWGHCGGNSDRFGIILGVPRFIQNVPPGGTCKRDPPTCPGVELNYRINLRSHRHGIPRIKKVAMESSADGRNKHARLIWHRAMC